MGSRVVGYLTLSRFLLERKMGPGWLRADFRTPFGKGRGP